MLLVLIFLVVITVVALLMPAVQTELARRLSAKLSADLGAELHIDRVELRIFGPNRLHGVFIADLKGDTLIAADEIWVRGLRVHPKAHAVSVKRLELHRSRFALERAADDLHSNLTNLLDKLFPPTAADTTASAPWRIRCREVDIRQLHFTFHDGHYAPLPFGVDFSHVDIPAADIIGRELLVAGDSVCFIFDKLAFADRSGLVVRQLGGQARIAPRGIRVQGLHLVTAPRPDGAAGTDLRGDLDLRTKDLGDLEEFTSRVHIDARIDSSRLQFADVALFAPDLRGLEFEMGLTGHVQGRISGLKGRRMRLRFGERSVFRGDVEMTGLPDFPNTFIVLDADHIATGPADLTRLPVPPFADHKLLQVPAEVQRLGRMAFAGNFTGFINSFTTYGTATTEAGVLRSDISYERDTVSGWFDLKGRLATDGFQLGKVLDTRAVGLIALDTKVAARGKDLPSMVAEINGSVPQLGLERYTIRNIGLDGKLERNLFNGALHCDDPKLQMDFNGLADLRGRWPEVDFTADVRRMDLRALGLLGGQGYSDVQMRINAKGQLAPDSLQGHVRLQHVTYCEDSLELDLGDIALDAWRENGSPMVEINSTMADLQVKGTFLPTLLPGALESTMLGIFPSLSAQVKYPKEAQAFTLDATLKDAQPLLDLAVPGMKLGKGARITGGFDSHALDLDLNASLPAFAYKGFTADSLHLAVDKTMDLLAFSLEGMGRVAFDSIALAGLYVT
ncbi:MAG: hypothetical protein JSS25_04735, partial [Proteobacteria bacterium]|nr:hypothetical protein [Pseudomonadota bacterium]